MSGYLISRMRKLAVDRGGVAAMEFALLLPFMAALYFGAIGANQPATATVKDSD